MVPVAVIAGDNVLYGETGVAGGGFLDIETSLSRGCDSYVVGAS